MEHKKWLRPADLILLGAILALAALVFFLRSGAPPAEAVIRQNGAVVAEIPMADLTETRVVRVGACAVEVGPEGARFIEADCPDRLCVRTGLLTRPGQTAACVPNGVTVTILGETELDAISY